MSNFILGFVSYVGLVLIVLYLVTGAGSMTVKELIEDLKWFDQDLDVACFNCDNMKAMTSSICLVAAEMHVPEDLRKYKRYDDPIPNGKKVVLIYG